MKRILSIVLLCCGAIIMLSSCVQDRPQGTPTSPGPPPAPNAAPKTPGA